VTLDFRLPWDGRARHLYFSRRAPFSMRGDERLEIGSVREAEFVQWLLDQLRSRFGDDLGHVLADPATRRAADKWFYVLPAAMPIIASAALLAET
jgi:hypothetical protein